MVGRSLNMLRVAIAVAALAPAAAAAPARIDWGRGLVIADGLGIADRHAPSPAVARGTSRRAADDQARKALAAALPALPLAAGGTVADKLGDAQVKARLDRAVDHAFAIAAEPETDGAWNVTLAVPLEAVRQAIAGPRVVSPAGDTGPAVIVVEVAEPRPAPAVGWTFDGHAGAALWPPPAVHVRSLPSNVPDIDWMRAAPRVDGKVVGPGAIALPAGTNATDATLFVVIGSPS